MNHPTSDELSLAYAGRRVFVTGHTGFKGAWLTRWLLDLGAEVTGYALAPDTSPSLFDQLGLASHIRHHVADVRDLPRLTAAVAECAPDVVFHLAAQPLVRRSYDEPVLTLETNVMGTAHVLEAIRSTGKACAAVMVTSDKCYENREQLYGYREDEPMGGHDVYSMSKGASELVIASWRRSFFPAAQLSKHGVAVASGRAGNVIGGGDWAIDRIVPDCVKAWSLGNTVELRNPHSTRPWQHVLEPLSGYVNLAIALSHQPEMHGESFNFGPPAQQNHSVLELVRQMALHWDKVSWKDVSQSAKGPYESGLLKLNCDKALHHLRWHAVMGFEDTVRMTAEWYRAFYQQPASIADTTDRQIADYTAIAKHQGLAWAQ